MNLIKLLQQFAKDIHQEKGRPFDQSLVDDDYEQVERAGIMEFDGELSREKAEKAAGISEE